MPAFPNPVSLRVVLFSVFRREKIPNTVSFGVNNYYVAVRVVTIQDVAFGADPVAETVESFRNSSAQ